jgi:hypothetical protein
MAVRSKINEAINQSILEGSLHLLASQHLYEANASLEVLAKQSPSSLDRTGQAKGLVQAKATPERHAQPLFQFDWSFLLKDWHWSWQADRCSAKDPTWACKLECANQGLPLQG